MASSTEVNKLADALSIQKAPGHLGTLAKQALKSVDLSRPGKSRCLRGGQASLQQLPPGVLA